MMIPLSSSATDQYAENTTSEIDHTIVLDLHILVLQCTELKHA